MNKENAARELNAKERGTTQTGEETANPPVSGEKSRMEKAACEELELLYCSEKSRKLYQKLNAFRNGENECARRKSLDVRM